MSDNIIDFNDLKKKAMTPGFAVEDNLPDISPFNEVKEIITDRITRSLIIVQLTAAAMAAIKEVGLDQNKFHLSHESVDRYYGRKELNEEEDEDSFNGIWFDWRDGDMLYRVATSVYVDMDDGVLQTDVDLFRIMSDYDNWEFFEDGEWKDYGPPADYFEWLLDDEDFYVGWDDDEEIDPEDEDSLWDVGIPSRSITALEKAGVNTVADLVKMSLREARKIKGIGDKSLAEIVALLGAEGFEMRP